MKLIALDLDGTLLNSDKVVSQRNFAALSRAAEQGHVIVPATGRALRAIPEQVMAFPFLHYAITINGAKVSDTRSGAVFLRAEIAPRAMTRCMTVTGTTPVGWTGRFWSGCAIIIPTRKWSRSCAGPAPRWMI